MNYGLMTAASLTAVGAFEAVGSVLVTAFMIAPPAAAYLLTENLKRMLALSVLIAAASGILGYHSAVLMNVSIAGCMAVWTGIFFLGAFTYSVIRKHRAAKKRA